MIGRRGFRIVEPARASCGLGPSTPAIEHRRVAAERQLAAALTLPGHARAPPGQGSMPGSGFLLRGRRSGSGNSTGPAVAPLAQANQTPPETDYGTESVMTTHTTLARARCKGGLHPPSCEIAPAMGTRPGIPGCEAYP